MFWVFKLKRPIQIAVGLKCLYLLLPTFFIGDVIAEVSDPTRPIFVAPEPDVVVEKEIPISLKLQSIYYGENKKLAIINDAVVGVGDSLEHWKIKKIERQSVVLVKKGQQKRIALVPSIVTPTK